MENLEIQNFTSPRPLVRRLCWFYLLGFLRNPVKRSKSASTKYFIFFNSFSMATAVPNTLKDAEFSALSDGVVYRIWYCVDGPKPGIKWETKDFRNSLFHQYFTEKPILRVSYQTFEVILWWKTTSDQIGLREKNSGLDAQFFTLILW